jgi:glycosyltransferase involved in cell wall biosynthesis
MVNSASTTRMSGPLVSVIVAVYNGARFLRPALESLLAQNYEPFETVFVDDGSEDETAEIAQSFPGIRYIRQTNQGLAAARNAGLELARGEFLAFLDADDLLPPNKLSVQVGYLCQHPEVGCVLGRQEIILEEGVEPPSWLSRDLLYGDVGGIPLGSAMIRRSILENLGGFDPSYLYAEDRDLFVRMRERGVEVAVLPDRVLYRRLHGSNMNFNRPSNHPLLRSLKAKLDRSRIGVGPTSKEGM